MRLQSIRIRNFKAIVDSKTVRLGALTAFIGQNGSGKSSLIEALETYQTIVAYGLDVAMQPWMGIEHARHKTLEAKEHAGEEVNPIVFEVAIGDSPRKVSRFLLEVNNDPAANRMFISKEYIDHLDGTFTDRDSSSTAQFYGLDRSLLSAPLSVFQREAEQVMEWQFLTLQPERMGHPVSQQRTGGSVCLAKDGSNITDFLRDICKQDVAAFNGIVEAMTYVLPYARDLLLSVTSELEHKVCLQLPEADFKVPGWMLSTGTLRMLALLALLRHPNPPPLIVVEEIENGLDPRCIHLIVEEIRNAVLSGVTQVIVTTHSPYLLDLLTLEHLVLVERDDKGEPLFFRPADNDNLQRLASDFAPGKLYTMGNLARGKS